MLRDNIRGKPSQIPPATQPQKEGPTLEVLTDQDGGQHEIIISDSRVIDLNRFRHIDARPPASAG